MPERRRWQRSASRLASDIVHITISGDFLLSDHGSSGHASQLLEALAQQEVFTIKKKVPVWATLDGPRATATTTAEKATANIVPKCG
jgi:hypothetical protein